MPELSVPQQGAWIVYQTDWNPIPVALFKDELEARRWADDEMSGVYKVRFWRFGTRFEDIEGGW